MDAEYKEAFDDTALPGPTSEMPELASEEQKAARASQPAPSAPSASEASWLRVHLAQEQMTGRQAVCPLLGNKARIPLTQCDN